MPELPEVETVVRMLRPKVEGKTVIQLTITDPKVVSKKLLGLIPFKIVKILRKGKYIFMTTNTESTILVHLRMTGHFHYLEKGTKDTVDQKHPSHEYRSGLFLFSDGSAMTFNEIRRFGRVEPLTLNEYNSLLARIGPDPMEISGKQFVALLGKYPQANIKTKLLDQAVFGGIGNIYAQESLYHAGILPSRKIGEVSAAKLGQLHTQLARILQLAIEKNGTTVSNYRHLDGKGDFAGYLAVYKKMKCPKGHTLRSGKLGGRGTAYCPTCQR